NSLAGMFVRAGSFDAQRPGCFVGRDGHYFFSGIEPGRSSVAITDSRGKHRLNAEFSFGDVVEWSPTLAAPVSLTGRVVNETGPVAEVQVRLVVAFGSEGGASVLATSTDAKGRFAFPPQPTQSGRIKI
ncbi:MAG: carboxypeptidase regulatory-like domain-containing protein, partial [Planctomycetes bacterium]|nr:carboxypeptidase regulatory-like domain-containing protein [Planctomycetota bacterium]